MVYIFDIDGTLSFNGVEISQRIVNSIQVLIKRGHQVIFASARPIRDMVEIVPVQFNDCIWIGGNGAFVKQSNEIVAQSFDMNLHRSLVDYIENYNLEYMVDSTWDYTYKASTDYPLYNYINHEIAENILINEHQKICKLVIFKPSKQDIKFFEDKDVSVHFHSHENIVDISPGKCDKYEALKELGVESYKAFGNDANDVALFKHAQYAYCVGTSEYSKYADKTIDKAEVSHYIELESKLSVT